MITDDVGDTTKVIARSWTEACQKAVMWARGRVRDEILEPTIVHLCVAFPGEGCRDFTIVIDPSFAERDENGRRVKVFRAQVRMDDQGQWHVEVWRGDKPPLLGGKYLYRAHSDHLPEDWIGFVREVGSSRPEQPYEVFVLWHDHHLPMV